MSGGFMYRLSNRSKRQLEGVHPDQVMLVHEAIKITPCDFGILPGGGIRTREQQREYVRRGVSWTMNSKHLPQHDGYGHAVDLVPYFQGGYRWEWALCEEIAGAMRDVARAHGIPIEWGGFKGFTRLDTVDGKIRHTGRDGPHFQLGRAYR